MSVIILQIQDSKKVCENSVAANYMKSLKSIRKILQSLNYDLFGKLEEVEPLPIASKSPIIVIPTPAKHALPSLEYLYQLFDKFNILYFDNKLPQVKITYSTRMTNAGSYTPALKLIKISKKYHEIFPNDIEDTLKHEMIHIIHFYHNADFKKEAARIGASLKAKSHPLLRRKPKYLYICPGCKKEYPRQKRIRMASCGICSDKGKFDNRFKLKLYKD